MPETERSKARTWRTLPGAGIAKYCATAALFFVLLAGGGPAFALICASLGNGNWNVAGTWSCAAVPTGSDDVQIQNGNDVTIPSGYSAAANSVTFVSNSGTGRLIHAASTSTLTVGAGGVTINAPGNNNTNSWDIFDGSATVNGPVTLVGGSNNNRVARIRIDAGTLDINGDLTMNALSQQRTVIDFNDPGNLFLSGNFTLTNGLGTLSMAANSTFTYDTAAAATVATGSDIVYRNLTINKPAGTATTTSTPTPTRDLVVDGNLTVQAGTFDITGVNAEISGNTSLSGELKLSSATGTKIFTGNVTINAGTGIWNNTGNAAVTMSGDLTNNNAAFTAFISGTGAYTFTTGGHVWASVNGLTFSGNVNVNGTRTNNTTTTIGGNLAGSSTLTNSANQTLNIGGNSNGISTLNASASGNTVNYNGTGAQIAENTTYYHLRIDNTVGPVTLQGNIDVRGNLINNGNFDPATGNRRVTFSGSAAQSLLGTATSTNFYNVTLNNSSGLTLVHNMNIANDLTLTNGRITTGANTISMSSGANINGASSTRFIVGNLSKGVATGGKVTRTFEIGTDTPAVRYVPVTVVFSSVTTAGALTVSTTIGDHPNIASSAIDPAFSVNRYWTFTNSGTVFTTYTATLNFINPADLDPGVDPLVFIAQRFNPPYPAAGVWTGTVVNTGASSINIIGETGFGDFAVGTLLGGSPGIGRFNAYETATAPGATNGVIKTKVAATAFQVDIIALNVAGTAIDKSFTGTVRVELLDASDNSGALDANACRPSWTVIQTISPDPTILGSENGRKTITVTENNAWRVVRFRIRNWPASTRIGCSTDAFAIRPNAFVNFSVSDNDWETVGTGRLLNDTAFGAVTHKAGRPFSIRATAQNAVAVTTTNYAGTPSTIVDACAGAACTTGFGEVSVNSAFVAGQLVADAATYTEVGSIRAQLIDDDFASVDNVDGSTLVQRRIQSGQLSVGRFVPDHFAVSITMPPEFGTACASFTYVGQRFAYTVQPVMTVQAQNFANNTTVLYAGSWWRIANSNLTGKSYAAATGTVDTADVPPTTDPVIRYNGDGIPSPPPPPPGEGTLTFSSGTAPGSGLFFTRPPTPVAPFDAEISLVINVIDADNVVYAANPASIGQATAGNGITFSSGKDMRFGRLRLGNATGSNLLPLTLRMETQYWVASGYFITNTADNCTTITTANVGLSNFSGTLASGDTTPGVPLGPFSNGIKLIKLSAPGASESGSLDVVVNLNTPPGLFDDSCPPAFSPLPTPTGANLTFLRGKWCGGTYDHDPKARARFGAYRGGDEVIYFREVF